MIEENKNEKVKRIVQKKKFRPGKASFIYTELKKYFRTTKYDKNIKF